MAENVAANENINLVSLGVQSNTITETLTESIDSNVLSVFSNNDGMSLISRPKEISFEQKQEDKMMLVIKEINEGNNVELKATIDSIIEELKSEFSDSDEPMSEEDYFMTAVSTYCEFLEDTEEDEEDF